MSTLYLIGGAPRTGKTTVLEEFIKIRPVLSASTDAIRSVAKALIDPENNPRLHKIGRGDFGSDQYMELLQSNPSKILDFEISAAEETWKSVLAYLSYYQAEGRDAAIEGYAILPKDLVKQDFDYKVVYIINLNDQSETILSHAKANPNDWLHAYSDEVIKAYCKNNHDFNKYLYDEAVKYKLPVVLVGVDFQAAVNLAVKTLLN